MWKKISRVLAVLLSCVCLVGATGCDAMDWLNGLFDKSSSEDTIADYSVQEYLLGQKNINVADSYSTNFSDSGKDDTLTDDELAELENDQNFSKIKVDEAEALNQGKEVVYKKKSAEYGIEDLAYWGANNNITYPGALLRIDQSGTGLSPLVGLAQKPVTLSLGLEGATGVDYQRKTAKEVTQSSVGECINSLIKGFLKDGAQLPYIISMQLTEIKAKEEINAALGLSFNVGSFFNMDGEFDFQNKASKTYAILTLKQIYYTVNVDYKSSLGAYSLLGDNVTLEQVKAACPENFSPVYVSSVSYGRIAAITLKTEESFQSLRVGLNMSGGYGMFSADTQLELEQKAESGSFEYNCFVYGGSVEGTQSVLSCKSIDKMMESLNQPYDPSKQVGVPISYQLSHIADNSSAKIGFVGDYYYADYIDTIRSGMEVAHYYPWDRETRLTVHDNVGDWEARGAAMIANSNGFILDLSTIDLDYIKAKGENLKIKIALDIAEADDGYQEIYIFNASTTAKQAQNKKVSPLASIACEHGVGKKVSSYNRYIFTASIDPEKITSEKKLVIVLDAYGDSEDTWYCNNLETYISSTTEDTYAMYRLTTDLLTEEKYSSFEEVLNVNESESVQ